MVIVDPNGDMLSKFGRPRDVILNPYDRRTQGWSFFNEIRNDYDFQRYALSVVPRGKTSEAEEWAGYGRLLLRETARKLTRIGNPSIRELFRWTTLSKAQTLRASFRSLVVLGGSRTDPKTCDDMSLSLGEHEVERNKHSRSTGHRRGTSRSLDVVRERVVMPAEIATLPDLVGLVAFAGDRPVARTRLDIKRFKTLNPAFEETGA